MRTLRAFFPALLALAMLCACSAQEKPCVLLHPANGEPVKVRVELARTAGQRAMGLMYRKKLGIDRGMLFLFEREHTHQFTMRNTSLPLDMLFIDNSLNIAGTVEHAKPYANGPFGIERPSRYVLEVNAGFCSRNGISAGDRVEFLHIPIRGTP